MNYNMITDKICAEAILQTQFYSKLNIYAKKKDKLNFIKLLIEKYNCEFDDARIVCDYFIDGTPLPSTLSKERQEYNNAVAQDWLNKPKCPTCGSENIKKVSSTAKVAGALTFGLFSKTARSQFCCKNCGYKW